MNARSKYAFILGGLLAAIGWIMAWPEHADREEEGGLVEQPEKARRSRPVLRSPAQLRELVERLKNTSGRVSQRDAVRELRSLRESEIQDLLLDLVGDFSGDYWDYPEAAKLLLVELGRRDAAAALDWSWKNLRESRGWAHAFEQIGPQWAWDDPEGFFYFAKDHLRKEGFERDLTMKELLASPAPILGSKTTNGAQLWLVKSSPRLAFRLVRLSLEGGSKGDMVKALHTEADFTSALSAWDDYDPEVEEKLQEELNEALAKSTASPEDESLKKAASLVERQLYLKQHPRRHSVVREICARWKRNDPESFAKSPNTGWDERMN